MFRLIQEYFHAGMLATTHDYASVKDEIRNLEYRVPIYRAKITSTLKLESDMIHLYRVFRTSITCVYSVLETLLAKSSELYIDCFILEIRRLRDTFQIYITQFHEDYPFYDPNYSQHIPLATLYPELYTPIPPAFPTSRDSSSKQELLRNFLLEIEKRGGMSPACDFKVHVEKLRALRHEFIRLDSEDLGSLVFRQTLYRRLLDTMSQLKEFVASTGLITPRERRVHAYVYHTDLTQLLVRMRQSMAYRVTGVVNNA